MHHIDGDDVTYFCFSEVGTNTEAVTVPNSTTSGVDETDDAITSVVYNTKMNTVIMSADIVSGNKSPKIFARVNPVLPVHKNPVT